MPEDEPEDDGEVRLEKWMISDDIGL